jgi:hypothetical protein
MKMVKEFLVPSGTTKIYLFVYKPFQVLLPSTISIRGNTVVNKAELNDTEIMSGVDC